MLGGRKSPATSISAISAASVQAPNNMPKALTIFGVGNPGEPAKFCYGQLQTIRGPGAFPEPRPSSDAPPVNISVKPLELSGLQLTAWDATLDDAAWIALSTQFDAGAITIPAECPIEPGRVLGGPLYGPLIISEDQHRLNFSGAGRLDLVGMAVSDEPDRLLQHLEASVGRQNVASALVELVETLAVENDLADYFKARRRLGVVEHAYRFQDTPSAKSMEARTEELRPRSAAPARHFEVHRQDVALNTRLQVRATLRNFDEVLVDHLVEMPADASTASIEAPNHITEAEVSVYGESGDRVDFIAGFFPQGINFGFAVQGSVDQLPPPVGAAGGSPDLESRGRLQTMAFAGPSAGDRSGTLDQLRRNQDKIDRIVGPRDWRGESRWFEAGLETQLDVIRWIKRKLEQPTIAKAYLLDPYLGTEALKRVILRNGNESIDLTILLSPGGVDPDAATTDARATDDYLARLVAAAAEAEARLCGTIKIIHVRRGDGGRQAFHDRYLVLIDRQGVPQVYLLSNSLSRAAGDWPFAVSELDRPTSWKILAYAEGLMRGEDGSRTITSSNIWERAPVRSDHAAAAAPARALTPAEQAASQFINRLLLGLGREAARLAQEAASEFIAATPADLTSDQAERVATAAFSRVGHLPNLIMFVADALDAGTDVHKVMASRLGDLQRGRFLDSLSDPNGDFVRPNENREAFLRRLGSLLAQDPQPTNLIRSKLNPAMQRFLQNLERQRGVGWNWVDTAGAAVYTIIVALHAVLFSTTAPIAHRIGAATDYIHWFGRLLRTEMVDTILEQAPSGLNVVGDMDLAINAILECRVVLGDRLAEPLQRLIDDPYIRASSKARLGQAAS